MIHRPNDERLRLRREYAAARTALDRLRAAAERYDEALERTLTVYRSQRAWKIMLAVRAAYAALRRGGPWTLEDLPFPRIADYLPPKPAAFVPETAFHRVYPAELHPPDGYDVLVLSAGGEAVARPAGPGHRVFRILPASPAAAHSTAPYHAVPLAEGVWEVHIGARNPVEQYRAIGALYRDWAICEATLSVESPACGKLADLLLADPLVLPEGSAFPSVSMDGGGDYIAFLEAGVVAPPGWTGRLLRHLVDDPSIGLICAACDEQLPPLRQACERRGVSHDIATPGLACAVMPRDVFEALGGSPDPTTLGLRICEAEDCVVHRATVMA